MASNTQPLGVSVDSKHSHAHFGKSLGGVSFPLLADFHPKGKLASSFGLYLEEAGITARATVIVDAGGIVRYVVPVREKRDMEQLAAECEAVDAAFSEPLPRRDDPPGLPGEPALYIKSNCGFSQAVLLALQNLHLNDAVQVRNVSEDKAALDELEKLAGTKQAPCLVTESGPVLESKDIIAHLVDSVAPL